MEAATLTRDRVAEALGRTIGLIADVRTAVERLEASALGKSPVAVNLRRAWTELDNAAMQARAFLDLH